MRAVKMAVTAIGAIVLAACGGSSGSTSSRPTTPGFYIQIRGMAFSPGLHVPPGATVTVLNDDSMSHSVTSESAPNAFTPGSVAGISFDTGAFGNGNRSFTLPADAREGTAIPYYCSVHKSTMATPNGTVTIDSSAKPALPPVGPSGNGPGY